MYMFIPICTHMYVFIYVWDTPEEKLREKMGEILFKPLVFSSPFLICLKTTTKIPDLLLVMWNFKEINLILTSLAEKLKKNLLNFNYGKMLHIVPHSCFCQDKVST